MSRFDSEGRPLVRPNWKRFALVQLTRRDPYHLGGFGARARESLERYRDELLSEGLMVEGSRSAHPFRLTEAGARYVREAEPRPFGPERAQELWDARGPQNTLSPTPSEDAYVREVWEDMPDHCAWIDAFFRIKNGER